MKGHTLPDPDPERYSTVTIRRGNRVYVECQSNYVRLQKGWGGAWLVYPVPLLDRLRGVSADERAARVMRKAEAWCAQKNAQIERAEAAARKAQVYTQVDG